MKRSRVGGDASQRAWEVVQVATGQATPEPVPEKDPAAVARGRKGALARMYRLTPAQRSEDARNAANVRWGRVREA